MTKQDYIKIANTLKKLLPYLRNANLENKVVNEFCIMLTEDSKNFDYKKFWEYILNLNKEILIEVSSENIIEDYKGCSDICCINLQEGGK